MSAVSVELHRLTEFLSMSVLTTADNSQRMHNICRVVWSSFPSADESSAVGVTRVPARLYETFHNSPLDFLVPFTSDP